MLLIVGVRAAFSARPESEGIEPRRVLNTCLYHGFPADLADREEAESP